MMNIEKKRTQERSPILRPRFYAVGEGFVEVESQREK